MAPKYRGKYKGVTRDPYEIKVLLNNLKSETDTRKLEDSLNQYFHDQGYCTGSGSNNLGDNDYGSFKAYHVGGATIGMLSQYNLPPFEPEPLMKDYPNRHFIQLKLISNQGLSDIVQDISKNFSYFKEINPKNELM